MPVHTWFLATCMATSNLLRLASNKPQKWDTWSKRRKVFPPPTRHPTEVDQKRRNLRMNEPWRQKKQCKVQYKWNMMPLLMQSTCQPWNPTDSFAATKQTCFQEYKRKAWNTYAYSTFTMQISSKVSHLKVERRRNCFGFSIKYIRFANSKDSNQNYTN